MTAARTTSVRILLTGLLLCLQAGPATAGKPTTSGSWSEGTYNFGRVGVGVGVPRNFTFTNTGTATVRKPTVALTGADFALSGNTCATAVLSTNQTCSVTITYTPGALGASAGGGLSAAFGKITASETISGTGAPALNDIAIGENSACAIVRGAGGDSSGVMCWGANNYGQLGNDSTTASVTPVWVAGLTTGVTAVRVGAVHTCVLVNGGVKCWGYNGDGELGNNSTTNSSVPVDVVGLSSGVVNLSVAATNSCVVTSTGAAACWGYGYRGVLGNGSDDDSWVPTTVIGLGSGVQTISTSGLNTCVLTTSGAVKCWGYNAYGAVGDGTTTDRYAVTDVSGLSSGVAALSTGGYQTCVLMTNSDVQCWGWNAKGQLGIGTLVSQSTPVWVATGYQAISSGYIHVCGRTISGVFSCWGWNLRGQVGDGTNADATSPVVIAAGANSLVISNVPNSTCIIDAGRTAKCWGYNYSGQLGNGTKVNSNVPVAVVL